MIGRRDLLIALGLAPLASFAQQPPAKLHRIGYLGAVSPGVQQTRLEAFRAGLLELGYVEGKNFIIDFRWAEGKYERLPDLAAELVRLNVGVIVTHGTPGVRAAKKATTIVPIVIAAIGDPVASGFVSSLARPGGNITGSAFFQPELLAKRLELLKEAMPHLARVAYLTNPDNPGGHNQQAMEIAAKSLKVGLRQFAMRGPDDFASAFSAMAKARVDSLVINEDAMFIANARAIADLAAKQQLLSAGGPEFAQAGGLLAYGVDGLEMYRRAGYFVDRILKGAKPGDLPIERATKFELVVNMRIAKALGITIPQSILLRADRVIE